ncbi:Phosphatidylserine decarboxylase-related protein [Penicillium griseofulvum]|uniref:Phosphatidylserine decarboxylase-related protein n=1 Tax=Penicillium patulum TaxID=5078 RepID=A0A135LS91_PENPA|nr:Phosphatidylserine decarboxylase-related protein [Penicillium griseofulvum]KXG51825.1 Phosphatidylserine decarboxylase-related protein [Penicillium griseofulvum]
MADDSIEQHHLHKVGKWMPADHKAHKEWLGGIIRKVDENEEKTLHPVLEEFKQLIETNTRVYMLLTGMFKEVPRKKPYVHDPTGNPEIRDYSHFLHVLNHLLTTAPTWTDKAHRVGLVGLPINAVLDWPMGTPSGFAALLDPEINAMLKKVLNVWGDFLRSPASADVLNDSSHGWFGATGIRDLTAAAKVGPMAASDLQFHDLFECDPSAPNHGYKSWDDFFTRKVKEGIRPVEDPEDGKVIANACESKPFRVAHHAHARDRFWVKGQPYSVLDMLDHNDLAPQFVGGTVYQAFLSALSYHRWHSPVTGKVVKAYVVDGTYYSEPLFEGVGYPSMSQKEIDMAGQVTSQGYITSVATRALIFIEADEPAIGLVAFIGVGMAEVSTCDITVKEGDRVNKGDEIGMFHFGGSTHCLLFRKGVNVSGLPEPGMAENKPVRSKLAVVS